MQIIFGVIFVAIGFCLLLFDSKPPKDDLIRKSAVIGIINKQDFQLHSFQFGEQMAKSGSGETRFYEAGAIQKMFKEIEKL